MEKYFALHLKDQTDVELQVGMTVRTYDYNPETDVEQANFGTIVGFVGVDAINGENGDPIIVAPKVIILFNDGDTDTFSCNRADEYSDWECNDIVVV